MYVRQAVANVAGLSSSQNLCYSSEEESLCFFPFHMPAMIMQKIFTQIL